MTADTTGMVIVNFEALDSAVNSFKTSAKRIMDISEQMSANAMAIEGAIDSDAARDYVDKERKLAANITEAKQLLDGRVATLTALLEDARATEAKAEIIADNLSTFSMQ